MKIITNILKFVVFVGIGVGILYLLYQNQSAAYLEECQLKGIPSEQCSLLDKVKSDFRTANYFWVFLVLIAFTISNIARALRWNMLICPLGYQPSFANSFLSIMLAYFANLGFPRIGEVVRAGTFAKNEGIAAEKVMGTIVTDRIIDVICILLVTGLTVLLQYDIIINYINEELNLTERFGSLFSIQTLLILIGVGAAALVGLWLIRQRLQQSALFQKIFNIIKGFGQGVQTVLKLKNPFLFLCYTITIWVMYFAMTYLCFFAFEPTAHLPVVAGLLTFVFGSWGIVVPSPGGMGTYHFMIITALALYGISGDDAFSFANICFFSIQIGCNILFGILALILLPIINNKKQMAVN